MHVATDTVCRTNLFYLLDGFDGGVECLVVHGFQLTFFKSEAQLLAALFGAVLQIGAFGQPLRGIQNLATANGSAPQTYVIGIFQFGEVGGKAVFVQIINLFLTAQCHVACQRDDFHARSHDEESHVKTNLVVTRTRRTVGDGIRADFVGITCNGQCLEDTFGTYRNRIGTVTQNIAEYHVFQAFLIVFLRHVEGDVFFGAQLVGIFFVCLQLFSTETARIGTSCIYFVPFFFGKIHHRKRGIQTSAECDYYFLLLFHILSIFIFYPLRAASGRKALLCKCRIYGS